MVESAELASLRKIDFTLTYLGLGAKAAGYFLLFLWARDSEMGAGALDGIVAADVFTWIVFSLIEWQFRGFQVCAGLVFEIILVVLYVSRQPIFGVQDSPEGVAMAILFFMLFASVKTSLYAMEHVLEVTGVKE